MFLQDKSAKINAGGKTKKKQESLARWYRNNLTSITHRKCYLCQNKNNIKAKLKKMPVFRVTRP